MQKISASEALKCKIQEIEYQINNDFHILKASFLHMNVQLSSLHILKYTSFILLNAWLPFKGKQLIALGLNIFKVIVK